MKRNAFSLLELVLVLMLMGIVAAMAMPRLGSAANRATGSSAAKRLAADLEYLRDEARRRQEALAANIDVSGNKINMSDIDDPAHPGLAYIIDLGKDLPGAVILSANFGGTSKIKFDAWGTPEYAGAVIVGAGDEQWTISVDADTGRVVVTEQ